jgi:Na+/phosphate symporter
MILLAAYVLYKTQLHNKKGDEAKENLKSQTEDINEVGVVKSCNTSIIKSLTNIKNESTNVTIALNEEDRKKLKIARSNVKAINNEAKELKKSMHYTISKLNIENEDSGLYYVQVLDYLREMAHSLSYIVQPAYDHIENNHKPLSKAQRQDLLNLNNKLCHLIDSVIDEIKKGNYLTVDSILEEQAAIMQYITKIRKKHVKRIKEGKASTKASMLFFSIAHENNNIVLHMINLLKAQRDFMTK